MRKEHHATMPSLPPSLPPSSPFGLPPQVMDRDHSGIVNMADMQLAYSGAAKHSLEIMLSQVMHAQWNPTECNVLITRDQKVR